MNSYLRRIIYVLVLLAVPLATWQFVFIPRNQDIAEAMASIQERETRLQQIATVVATLGDLREAVRAGEAAIDRVEAKLPSRRDVETMLEQLWQVARRNDLTVKSVKTMSPVTSTVYRELPLKVQLKGPFEGYYRFLLELENLPRITRIFNMEIKRNDPGRASDDDPPGTITADFELSIYFADETVAWTRDAETSS